MIQASEQIALQYQNVRERVNPLIWADLIYNVKVYGAKGDGKTDDTFAIQSAINAAVANGGGVVFFPPGTYYLNSVQSIGMTPRAVQDPNLYIGNASNLKFIGTGNAILTTGNNANRTETIFFYKCKHIEIAGLQFKGNNTGLATINNNCAIGGVSCVDFHIHDCQLYGYQGSYIGFSWLFDSVIENNYINVGGGTAFDSAFLQNVVFRKNHLYGSRMGSNGIGTQGIQIIYDIPNAAYSTETGLNFMNGVTNHVTISENYITGFTTGIYLADMVDSVIMNNHIVDNYNTVDSQCWGIVLGNTRSDIKMEGIDIAYNKIYQNGSPISGGGITIGAGAAIGVEVDLLYNEIYDNSHVGLNIGSNNVTLRAKGNRFYDRHNANQTVRVQGIPLLLNNSLVIDNEGYNPIAPTLPAVPAGTAAANAVANNNPFPVTVYQAGGKGLHIVTPTGVDIAVSQGDQGMFRLPPYHKAYFSITNTIQWNWIYE